MKGWRRRKKGERREREREREREIPEFLRQKFGISSSNNVIASNQCTHRRVYLSPWHADYLKSLLLD